VSKKKYVSINLGSLAYVMFASGLSEMGRMLRPYSFLMLVGS
jgi:hypothetical protein